MAQTYAELEQEIRQLPAEQRSRLVDTILESLQESGFPEIEAEWEAEIARRVAAFEKGEAKLIPAEEVFAKARAIGQE